MFTLNPTCVDLETPTSRSLLDLARSGDARAFGEICRVYETRLLRQAMTLCGNAIIAEELAQDTLVEAWKSLSRYHGNCQFFTWLCAILLNRHRNTFRKKWPLPLAALGNRDRNQFQNHLDFLPDPHPQPDQSSQLREQAALVWKCLQALPTKQQQVVYLRFYVDDSLEGIASALGCSVGTVKSRLFHALDKLRGMNALRVHCAELQMKGESP